VRILLDESLPRPLARLLPEHDVRTVAAMGWAGKRNSELLRLAVGDFDALLTADQNLEHQQNVDALPIAVVVLVAPTNRIEALRPLIPNLLQILQRLAPRRLVHVRL
jgi:predicted nuclease of predicted toxin-antitoxin system